MKTFVDGEVLTASDLNANFLGVQPTYTGSLLAGVASGSKTTEITNTTVRTSVSGGVYVDISGWNGIHSVACTPRNSDQTPLAVSIESVTLTQVLLRFASRNSAYFSSAGFPITLTINGWK